MEVNVTEACNSFSKILKNAQAGQDPLLLKMQPITVLRALLDKHKEFNSLYS